MTEAVETMATATREPDDPPPLPLLHHYVIPRHDAAAMRIREYLQRLLFENVLLRQYYCICANLIAPLPPYSVPWSVYYRSRLRASWEDWKYVGAWSGTIEDRVRFETILSDAMELDGGTHGGLEVALREDAEPRRTVVGGYFYWAA